MKQRWNTSGTWTAIFSIHYSDVIMGTTASKISSLTIVYSAVYSGAEQRKHQSSASMVFVWGIHRWIPREFLAQNVSIWWRHHGGRLRGSHDVVIHSSTCWRAKHIFTLNHHHPLFLKWKNINFACSPLEYYSWALFNNKSTLYGLNKR